MLPAAGIGSLKPGPPSPQGSPMQVVRRTKSYAASKATKPMKPPVAATPADELVPPVTGQGITWANAVSAASQENGPHGLTDITALTGIVDGAKKNTAATVMVAIIRRSFICRPQRLLIDGRYFQLSSALHRAYRQRSTAAALHVRFSNRPFEVKHFQTIHHCSVDVAHGLALRL